MKNRKEGDDHPVIIHGQGLDEFGHRYFKLSIRNGPPLPPFSAQKIITNQNGLFAELADAGFNAFRSGTRTLLLKQLEDTKHGKPKFRVVTRLGWNRGAFVLPKEIIGKPTKRLEPSFRHLDQAMLAKYRMGGKLEDWKEKIGTLCIGNSRLIFGASLGPTGPILPLVKGPRRGGFQLSGGPETGKTATAMVTGSIWGCHRSLERRENGFAESWHSTAGKVELTALVHNGTVLILDETKLAGRTDIERGQLVVEVSFTLTEGREKERLTNTNPGRAWLFYFLSTSNCSLEEFASLGVVGIDDAVRGRIVDIPNPVGGYGIYENLHSFPSGEKFTDALKVRCRKYCGAVGEAFVTKLVKDRKSDRGNLKTFLKGERKAYNDELEKNVQATNLRKPLHRATDRFATVFAAGSLAIKYRLFPWDRAAQLNAILSCQLDGLKSDKPEIASAKPVALDSRAKLVAYLTKHRSSFLDLRRHRPKLGSHKMWSVPGYIDKFKGKKWFYISGPRLRDIVGSEKDTRRLTDDLMTEGLMASPPKRGNVVHRPIYSGAKGNKGYQWVCAIRLRIVNEAASVSKP